jgi:hypothetical protein
MHHENLVDAYQILSLRTKVLDLNLKYIEHGYYAHTKA